MKGLSDQLKEKLRYPLPVLSNTLIRELMDAKLINIDPFEPTRLSATEYRLCPSLVRFHRYPEEEDGAIVDYGNVSIKADSPYILQPRESILVSPAEKIELAEGMVGEFYPSSLCIDQRLHLVAGRLHPGYRLGVVFGLQNTSDQEVRLYPDFQIARITFCWLGLDNLPDYSQQPKPATYVKNVDIVRKLEAEIEDEIRRLEKKKKALRKE